MPVDAKDFKKLLIDLDLTLTEIGEEVGVSYWSITRYFRGELRNRERRIQIKRVIRQRAEEKGVALPEFWAEAA